MVNSNDKFVKTLLSDFSRAMVGRICKQNEVIADNKSLTKEQALSLLKSFNRELIYESFRDLENQIRAFQNGKQLIKFSIYTPDDKKS